MGYPRDEKEGENGVTRNIIDEIHSWDIQEIKRKLEVVLLEVSLMNFVLAIFKEIKWKVKVVLLVVSFMNFILGISKEIK